MSNKPNLVEILLDLHKNSRSGVLRVERGSEKKQLVLNKGSLVLAESNLPVEHLARVMIKMNLLPQSKVNEIASSMKSGKTSEEAVLALSSSGVQSLEKGRREQAIVILASLWAWTSIDMHFYPGENLMRYRLNLGLSLPELIVLSARRAVSDHLIPTPPDFLQGAFSIAENSAEKARDFPLNSSESYIYSLLHESMNTADILPLITATETKPENHLLCLFILGLITPKELILRSGDTLAATESNSLLRQLDDMLLRFEMASLYEVLSIPVEASQEEIQAAYYGLAKQFHPDRFQSKEFSADICLKAQQVFTHINEAYITLKDPESRAGYDERRLTKESKVEAELKARAAGRAEDEKTAAGLFHEGRALLARGDFEKAVERLKGSVWLCPEKAAYHHYLGVAQSAIPNLRKSAEQHLLKAIELNKTSTASHLELAKLYVKVMLRRKAEQQLQELLRWDPENKEAHKLFDELKNLENAQASGRRIKNPFARS